MSLKREKLENHSVALIINMRYAWLSSEFARRRAERGKTTERQFAKRILPLYRRNRAVSLGVTVDEIHWWWKKTSQCQLVHSPLLSSRSSSHFILVKRAISFTLWCISSCPRVFLVTSGAIVGVFSPIFRRYPYHRKNKEGWESESTKIPDISNRQDEKDRVEGKKKKSNHSLLSRRCNFYWSPFQLSDRHITSKEYEERKPS